ncbi:MAG: hypothetical protein ACKPKO_07260, partial [Candidatus Fonsibacter sp.]
MLLVINQQILLFTLKKPSNSALNNAWSNNISYKMRVTPQNFIIYFNRYSHYYSIIYFLCLIIFNYWQFRCWFWF